MKNIFCAIYFYNFLLKTKDLNSMKMMLHHEKCKLYNPLLVEYDVYVKKASYTLIVVGSLKHCKYGIHLATFPTADTILRHLNRTYEYVNSGSSYL
jgi:hypothetical protein